MPALDAIVTEKSNALREQGRWRELKEVARNSIHLLHENQQYISFSCNDYFGLSDDPRLTSIAMDAMEHFGVGSGASRLVTGNHPLHAQLEAALAKAKSAEAATLFGSGYLANLGTIQALVGKGDLILADKLCHACMIDAAKLSGAKLLRFHHNDLAQAEELLKQRGDYQHCLILTETVFSMDGDRAPLVELKKLAEAYDAWLMTDDAHGFGFVKENPADIQLGTLSKGLSSYGGYVAGSKKLIAYLESAARSLIYSTALPPAVVATALEAVRIVEREPERAEQAMRYAKQFAEALGLDAPESPIVPVILGGNEAALDAAEKLKEKGLWVSAIRPPTVPEGTARLRVSFSAAHTPDQVNALIEAMKEVCDDRLSA